MGRPVALLLAASLVVLAGCTMGSGQIREDKEVFDAGYAAFEAGQWKRAVDLFSRFLRMNPTTEARGEVYYYRGECYVRLRNYREAMDDFQRALGADARPPIDTFAKVAIGNLYYEAGSDDRAVETYAEVLRKPLKELPLDTIALRMAVSLQRIGKWELADKYLAYLLDRYPESPAAAEAGRRMHADSFTVQVGAYVSMMTARNEFNRLQAAGFQPRLGKVTRGGQTLNTIQVGRLNTYAEAAALARRLARAGCQTVIVP